MERQRAVIRQMVESSWLLRVAAKLKGYPLLPEELSLDRSTLRLQRDWLWRYGVVRNLRGVLPHLHTWVTAPGRKSREVRKIYRKASRGYVPFLLVMVVWSALKLLES